MVVPAFQKNRDVYTARPFANGQKKIRQASAPDHPIRENDTDWYSLNPAGAASRVPPGETPATRAIPSIHSPSFVPHSDPRSLCRHST